MNATQYEEMLSLLQTIATRLERVEGRLAALEGQAVHAATTHAATPAAPAAENTVADDADLDGPYGNPEIKRDPPRWTGPSFAGGKFSDAPPDYLESLAGFFEWKARESDKKNEMANNGKPRSGYLRKDAARARGWARRNAQKSGGVGARPAARPAPRPKAPVEDEVEAEMPF